MARIDVSATSTIQGVHLAIFSFVSALRVRPTWSTRYSSAIFIPQQDPLFDDQGFFFASFPNITLFPYCYGYSVTRPPDGLSHLLVVDES